MDKIIVVLNTSTDDSNSVLFMRENGREHAYHNRSLTQWWRLIRAINYAMNDDYRAVITTVGWMIYRK